MNLNQIIREFLKSCKNKTLTLDQLERLCSGQVTYPDFASVIQKLMEEEILKPLKNSELNLQEPRLPYKYRLHKPLLNQEISREIQSAQKTYHTINLSNYYHLSQNHWEEDLPYIKQIHTYLATNEILPADEVLRTELSFQLVGDEKWIEEGKGQSILERLGLWDKLKIQKHPDPLMMAIDTSKIRPNKHTYFHLVVENKSTYYALLEELPSTMFTTLIYGQGWKITANITQLEKQLQTLKGDQKIYYFGDLDYEGIAIWAKLNAIRQVHIAKRFYKELLKQKGSDGSKNQKRQETAMSQFLSHFPEEKDVINKLLIEGSYYPQEAIIEKQLRGVFKSYKPDDKLDYKPEE